MKIHTSFQNRRCRVRLFQSKLWLLGCSALALLALAAPVQAQQYSIPWYKVAGGGGVSSGDAYSLTGTIGQHDDASTMSGGDYSLTGGFWSLIGVVQTPGGPPLTITHSGNSVTISWPSPSTGFELQENIDLANPAGWGTSGLTISDNGVTKSVTITPPTGNLFFQLKQSP